MNLLKDAKVIAALILAIGIAAGAWFLRSGVVAMAERGRNVTVKGLAVREVDADQVYWPIVFKEVGKGYGCVFVCFLTVLGWSVATIYHAVLVSGSLPWFCVGAGLLAAMFGAFALYGRRHRVDLA